MPCCLWGFKQLWIAWIALLRDQRLLLKDWIVLLRVLIMLPKDQILLLRELIIPLRVLVLPF